MALLSKKPVLTMRVPSSDMETPIGNVCTSSILYSSSSVAIKIQGHLDPEWADWLEGFTIAHLEDAEVTLLTGTVPDQTALYGLMAKLRDLSVHLISITYGESPLNG